jgi:hypothetical protein
MYDYAKGIAVKKWQLHTQMSLKVNNSSSKLSSCLAWSTLVRQMAVTVPSQRHEQKCSKY